jgi:hypothetical protein
MKNAYPRLLMPELHIDPCPINPTSGSDCSAKKFDLGGSGEAFKLRQCLNHRYCFGS